ncbi:MAG: hypothetical protein J7495_06925 [Sphingomonas sp.]|nr:hypothetical protein [Sphingomonas sp.]
MRRWGDSLPDAKRKLYCTPCRTRDRLRIAPWIDKTKSTPTGDPLPDPPLYEWKKLIARYRS